MANNAELAIERMRLAQEAANAGNMAAAEAYANAAAQQAARSGNAQVQQAVYNHTFQINQNFSQQAAAAEATRTTPASGGGGGGDTGLSSTAFDQDAANRAAAAAAEEAQRRIENERLRVQRQNILNTVRGSLEQFGLSSLLDVITGWVQQDYDADSIMVLLRTTQQYKDRFPAMEALAKKGRALSEAEYIAFERNAAQLERAYGLPAGMLGKDSVTRLLTNEVSAQELENRVTMAAAGAFQTSPEVKQQFRDYYGIDSGGLTAYFLDPEKAMPLLQKQYATAQIGAEATMRSIDLGVAMAEELQVAGIDREKAREGFGTVASQRAYTQGRGDVVTQEQLVRGNMLNDTGAQQAIARTAGARVGAFSGGGEFLRTEKGAVGLGSATT